MNKIKIKFVLMSKVILLLQIIPKDISMNYSQYLVKID